MQFSDLNVHDYETKCHEAVYSSLAMFHNRRHDPKTEVYICYTCSAFGLFNIGSDNNDLDQYLELKFKLEVIEGNKILLTVLRIKLNIYSNWKYGNDEDWINGTTEQEFVLKKQKQAIAMVFDELKSLHPKTNITLDQNDNIKIELDIYDNAYQFMISLFNVINDNPIYPMCLAVENSWADIIGDNNFITHLNFITMIKEIISFNSCDIRVYLQNVTTIKIGRTKTPMVLALDVWGTDGYMLICSFEELGMSEQVSKKLRRTKLSVLDYHNYYSLENFRIQFQALDHHVIEEVLRDIFLSLFK